MSADAPLAAVIVNIWGDGAVDVVVDDASLPNGPQLFKRQTYVPYGATFVPPVDPVTGNTLDPRYVAQLTTGSGLPAAGLQNTTPSIDGVVVPGTEPLES
jgi:hypothetical protein